MSRMSPADHWAAAEKLLLGSREILSKDPEYQMDQSGSTHDVAMQGVAIAHVHALLALGPGPRPVAAGNADTGRGLA